MRQKTKILLGPRDYVLALKRLIFIAEERTPHPSLCHFYALLRSTKFSYTWLELTSTVVFEVRAAIAYVHATVVAIARLIVQIVLYNGVDICFLYHTVRIFAWKREEILSRFPVSRYFNFFTLFTVTAFSRFATRAFFGHGQFYEYQNN